MAKTSRALIYSALLSATASVNAADLNIHGFMSVGGGFLSNDEITDPVTGQQSGYAGYDDAASFSPDTIIGLQFNSQVNDKTSVTAQLVSRGIDDYDTEASWAYASYDVTDDLTVKVGRIRTPFYYFSEFLEVGYAYNWIRPNPLVYRLDFISSIDGIDLTQNFTAGSLDGSVKVYYGRDDFNDLALTDSIRVDGEIKNFGGVILNLSLDNVSTRFSYHQAEATSEASDPSFVLASQLSAEDESYSFVEAAIAYDDGNWFAFGEWTAIETDILFDNDDTAYMLSAGKHFDNLMLHITYANVEEDGESNRLVTEDTEQQSIALGVRYDFDTGTAFKFEVEQYDRDLGSDALDNDAVLYSFAVDTVF